MKFRTSTGNLRHAVSNWCLTIARVFDFTVSKVSKIWTGCLKNLTILTNNSHARTDYETKRCESHHWHYHVSFMFSLASIVIGHATTVLSLTTCNSEPWWGQCRVITCHYCAGYPVFHLPLFPSSSRAFRNFRQTCSEQLMWKFVEAGHHHAQFDIRKLTSRVSVLHMSLNGEKRLYLTGRTCSVQMQAHSC